MNSPNVKWKLNLNLKPLLTKKTRQMMSETAKEIAKKIISHFQLRIVTMFVYSMNA